MIAHHVTAWQEAAVALAGAQQPVGKVYCSWLAAISPALVPDRLGFPIPVSQ